MVPQFNTVVILDSLKSESASNNLQLHIHHITVDFPVRVVLHRIVTLNDFLEVLAGVAEDLSIVPMIHISAHGDENGINLRSGEFAKWDVVLPALQKINIRLTNSLIVVASFCLGAHMIRDIEDYSRSPFRLLIAPISEVEHGLIESLMEAFYQGFLTSNSIKTGIEFMFKENGNASLPFILVGTTQLVHAFCVSLVERIDRGKAKHGLIKRYKEAYGEAMPHELKMKIQYPEEQVESYESIWLDVISKFLMLDLSNKEWPKELTPYLSFKDYYYRSTGEE